MNSVDRSSMNLQALYATVDTPTGPRTFRIGLPASAAVIWKRYERFDNAHYRNGRRLRVHLRNLSYPVRFLEIRAVDAQGRGLGRPDHFAAYGVQVSALRIEPDAPHAITYVGNKRWKVTGQCCAILAPQNGDPVVGYGRHTLDARLDAQRTARRAGLI